MDSFLPDVQETLEKQSETAVKKYILAYSGNGAVPYLSSKASQLVLRTREAIVLRPAQCVYTAARAGN